MLTPPHKGVHKMEIKRGQIYYADLSPVVGSEQGGLRPVLIVSNDIGNRHAPIVIAAAITSRIYKKRLPTQVLLDTSCGLHKESMVECEQLRTLDKRRLKQCMGEINNKEMYEVTKAIAISLGV